MLERRGECGARSAERCPTFVSALRAPLSALPLRGISLMAKAFPKRMRVNALFATLLLAAALPASASIAVFTDGRSMKVEKFKAVDEAMLLTIRGGGTVTVPLTRIDRIIDDEVATPEIVAEVRKIVEEHHGVFPERSWRYSEASAPL